MDNLKFLNEFEINSIKKNGHDVTTYWLKTISCKLSKYDLEKFISNFSPNKNSIIIASCSVIKRAQILHKKLINYLIKQTSEYDIFVLGCFLPSQKLPGIKYISTKELSILAPSHTNYIKIQDGCTRKCSFCLIRKLRYHYNIPYTSILQNIQDMYEKNKIYKILGEDVLTYNVEGVNFLKLIEVICKKFSYIKLHIPSIYPSYNMISKLIDLMIIYDMQIEKTLHLSIQHISEKILGYMKRNGYTKQDIIKIYNLCKENGIGIQYDVIIGFPYETNKDFQDLIDFIKMYPPKILNVFQYSNVEGVAANDFPQISYQTKKNRICKLKNQLYNIVEEINYQV